MLRVKAGELDRMGLLFQRHYRALYGFLFHMTYQREASEDMVQTVFYKMLRYRGSFTGEGEFVAWMYQIARNVLKDNAKKGGKQGVHQDIGELADRLPGGTNADEHLEKKQANAGLYKAMEKLSDDNREILTLSRFQELKYQEIGQILGITEGAAKVRAFRAMQELKDIYAKMER
ncbi:RNA polymerase sigma factor [Mucilaginibacter ginsenosidivorax]|uniref:Sigma-70 family RNA polymerase sigma factor n=1 Tax=Mucilaginibacter ginsenosidivorax TaxID=862126 RepID=A0A5B8VW40_9SPHI|nr:sigma-70 family RNA polymerase sigma factor [Mucilaginibacter ginsenosidivorax]QEC75391.1 sigma-70 family RNA polymerase sigma factor [Mucilaginibacter ginsenosidivorax]